MEVFKHNIFQLLVSLDQNLNVIFSMIFKHKEKAWADETLSAHAYRIYLETGEDIPMKIYNKIFFWQEDHCKEAYESEKLRKHLPS
jgi:hypothetical protein